ncbi:MAG: DNA primase [Spirochaetota bacterium]|nr:DNA primase [Spirochaetota bacterium]
MDSSTGIVNEIQNRINIVEVIGEHVSLKKQGKNHVGLCPFHIEKTPSFSVSEEKKLFYCFGCHEGGNVFHFLMKFKNLSFHESLVELGKRVGIDVKSLSTIENEDKFRFLLTIFNETTKIYHNSLMQNKHGITGLDYLKARSIYTESIQKFNLGYAPDEWTFLHKELTKLNYSLENQYKTALISKNKNQKPFDYFRNRVIFPIYDELNRVVAFGARVLDNTMPKYLNSPENYYFKKREILYGLNFAKDAITETKEVIVVEGYFDVIMAHQMGIYNVVAPLGTGITEKHIQKLKRYSNKIILVFDGDTAGENAMIRGLNHTLKADIETFAVSMPEGLDPFDFLVKYGSDAFYNKVNEAKSALEYRIEWILKKNPVTNDHQKRHFLNNLFSFLNTLESEVQKDDSIKIASELLGIAKNSINTDFINLSRRKYPVKINEKSPTKLSNHAITERCLLFTIINNPDLFVNYKNKINLDTFEDPISKQFFNIMFKNYENDGFIDIYKIYEELISENDKNIFMNELFSEKYQLESVKMIQDCLDKLKLNKIKYQRDEISKKIKHAKADNNVDLEIELLEEQQFLVNEANKIKQREKVV